MAIIPKSDSNIARCLCPKCPSYNDCAKGKTEKVYCSHEVAKSTCTFSENGCSCTHCPVHYDYSLVNTYYCKKGSAEDIG